MSDFQLFIPFYYLIIYKSSFPFDSDRSDSLIIREKRSSKEQEELEKYMHLWRSDITAILPAVNYMLHMPRYQNDLEYSTNYEYLTKYPLSQWISILSQEQFISRKVSDVHPITLIIYSDDCNAETKEKINLIKTRLGSFSVSELNEALLKFHWAELFKDINYDNKDHSDFSSISLLEGDYRLFLPAFFACSGYIAKTIAKKRITQADNKFYDALQQLSFFNTYSDVVTKLLKQKNLNQNSYETALRTAAPAGFNVVISFPGISPTQVKYGGFNSKLPDDEKEAIELIGLHRAIAKQAVYIELPCIPDDLFRILDELEKACKRGTNNNYVKRVLKKLGRRFQNMLSREQLLCIEIAKHITVLSNFPLGLAIINGSETPLQCRKPISYIPLTPLIRCFEYETRLHFPIIIGKKCKVIYAECVQNAGDDRGIFAQCYALYSALKKLEEDTAGAFEVCYKEIKNVKELNRFISDNSDADILHISAHGNYKPRNNEAVLCIGDEEWLADELEEKIPPIVVLSACHISPRGRGAVNAADCFLHNGAEAVLGTFIPVDANRNSILLARMYAGIAEELKGNKQFNSLAELWSFIVASNAIHEIIRGNDNLFKWMYSKNDKGIFRLEQFYERQDTISPATSYTDSIKILKEMLADEGLGNKYDQILNQKDYFEESYFYQWIGMPDNILFAEKF